MGDLLLATNLSTDADKHTNHPSALLTTTFNHCSTRQTRLYNSSLLVRRNTILYRSNTAAVNRLQKYAIGNATSKRWKAHYKSTEVYLDSLDWPFSQCLCCTDELLAAIKYWIPETFFSTSERRNWLHANDAVDRICSQQMPVNTGFPLSYWQNPGLLWPNEELSRTC